MDIHFTTQVFKEGRQYVVYTKPGVSRPVGVPTYRSVPVFVIKNNLRSGGISRNRYFELLELCP